MTHATSGSNKPLSQKERFRNRPLTHDQQRIRTFWQRLLDRAAESADVYLENKFPTTINWLYTEAGISCIRFVYRVWSDGKTGVQLEIATDIKDKNKLIFDRIYADKGRIEKQCGVKLQWERRDHAPSSYVGWFTGKNLDLDEESDWDLLQVSMLDAMRTFIEVLQPYIE